MGPTPKRGAGASLPGSDKSTPFWCLARSGIVKGGPPLTWGLGLCPNFPFFLFCAAFGGAKQEAGKCAHWLRSPSCQMCVDLSGRGLGCPQLFVSACARRRRRRAQRENAGGLTPSCTSHFSREMDRLQKG